MKTIIFKIYNLLKNKLVQYDQNKALETIWKDVTKYCTVKQLSSSQVRQIQEYWKPLTGKNVSTKWHQLLYSVSGVFKPEYEPFEVCMHVQNTLSPSKLQIYFDDKGLYRQLLHGFCIPNRVAECVNGVYILPEIASWGGKEVTFNDFIKRLQNVEDCIIKPSKGTDGGNGVLSFDVINGRVNDAKEDIRTFIDKYQSKYGNNFVIEEKIHECDNLQCLNPTSCNTLRVHTYRNRDKQEILFLSSYIRIGKLGKVVDNAYSGGYCGRISQDGYLDRIVRVYPYYKGTKTESGIDVSHYKIESFEKIVSTVLNAHSLLPMFDLVGWDVTVDKEGNVVIIEFNPNPDVRIEQCVFDTTCLGKRQKEIVKRVYKR